MTRASHDESWWLESLRVAEWNSFELLMDHWFPPPRSHDAGRWDHIAPFDWEGALRVLNKIFAFGREGDVARALSTNFAEWPGLEYFSSLFVVADRAYRLFPRLAITQAERKRKSKVIAQAARTIAEELGHPATQSDVYLGRYLLSEIEGSARRMPPTNPSVYENLAAIAEQMVDIPKVVGNPNSPTAHKLYFLRELTDYLSASYERPMRSLVLVLASLYFDVSDMTTNDLAKYAPVKKDKVYNKLFSPRNLRP